jgi:pilus assembly protein CpaB
MNKRLLSIFLIALVIAAGSAFFVYRIVGMRISAIRSGSTTHVVTAAADIKLGSILTSSDLTTAEVSGPIPKGAILKPENAIGRGALSNMYQGEIILDNRLAVVGSGGGLASTISRGMRACAVKVDEVVGVAGFVTAGMRVDVIISGNRPGQPNITTGPEVKTLLQNIEVLSAGTDIQKDSQGAPKQVQVVNLLVTPPQAEILSLASNQTHIQLVLRNPLDTTISETPGSTTANLFASDNVRPVPRPHSIVVRTYQPPQRIDSIEVINGSQRTTHKLEHVEEQK